MLLRIWPIAKRGVRRTGWARWRALDNDPQFLYAPRWFHTPFLVFDLASAETALDPRIYLDQGEGFAAGEEIQLGSTERAIFALVLASFPGVRRVRFDPSSFPTTFELRAYAAYDQASINAFIGRRVLKAAEADLRAPRYEKIAAPNSSNISAAGPRAPKIHSAARHGAALRKSTEPVEFSDGRIFPDHVPT